MILFPHFLVGAAIGSRVKNPIGLFFLAVFAIISHYLLDFTPHYDYGVAGLLQAWGADFFLAAAKIGLDFSSGIILVFLLAGKKRNFKYMLAGGVFALLPDLALFLSWQFNTEILTQAAYFGHLMHYEKEVASAPLYFEIFTQLAVSFLAILIILRKKIFIKK